VTDPSDRPSILKEALVKRAAIVGVFAAVMATAWTFLAAQQGPSPSLKEPIPPSPPTFGTEHPSPNLSPVAPPASADTPRPALAEPIVAAPAAASSLPPLQQRFIELSTKKANSLNAEQLQKAVNDLSEEVEALNAWSKVDDGARVLRDVAEKSPQTPAGRAAKAALRIIDQYRSANNLKVPTPFDDQQGPPKERSYAPTYDSAPVPPLKKPNPPRDVPVPTS
jgi:hypothetical protein